MITAKTAAKKWDVSLRNVQDLCRRGRIDGAVRMGRDWLIPANAAHPADGRKKENKTQQNIPLIRKTPFLDMTDLYSVPGTADSCALSIEHLPEAQKLFEAEIAYSRGDIDSVYQSAQYFLSKHSGFYAVLAGGMLLALCAMWKGDIDMWHRAKRHICEAPCKTDSDHDIIALALAATDSMIRRTEEYPDWFKEGRFDRLHRDAHPAARVYYIKYLLVQAHELAINKIQLENVTGLGFMQMLPYTIEPMISQAVAENTVMAEIYMRILCSVTYLQCGKNQKAAYHLDRAIELCLADRLCTPLAEHRRQLGLFLDERLALADKDAVKKVKEMHKKLHVGYVKLYNAVMQSRMNITLSAREREVALLVAYGLTNREIADRLTVSQHTVRAMLNSIKNKTGAQSRLEFSDYI